MKKILLILLMLPLLAVAAQWTKVGGATGSDFYIDKGSAIKADKGHKVWSLTSFAKAQSTPDGKAYLSVKALHLYSCEERTATLLSQVFYPEAMGKGELVQSVKYEKFGPEDIVPDSSADAALQAICHGKKTK